MQRFDYFVHDDAVRADEDAHDPVLGDRDEIHATHRKLQEGRHEHHADLIAHLRQNP